MSIKEIAKRAQVSSATVSRVLNNPDYKCSSPQVRERIRKAAIELNYVPNEVVNSFVFSGGLFTHENSSLVYR